MSHRSPLRRCSVFFCSTVFWCLALFSLLPSRLFAEDARSAKITGSVSNAATNQFLDNAEVKFEGTNIAVLTDRDGTFEVSQLAPGTYQVLVTYTGLDPERRSITLKSGEAQRQDFNLKSEAVRLNEFVVAAEPEGNAAAINKQKRADFFMNAVSADSLGAVSEGNIGEFLKYLPGLQVNYTNADASTVSMRGQDPANTGFTIDGVTPAAAGSPPRSSTGSGDASSRAFEFNQMTIQNIESVEVYKAPPPWMAPNLGGVINAVTKSGFDQKGRRVQVVTNINGPGETLTFNEKYGPGNRPTQRIKPGGSLNYSEAFLKQTLGVAVTVAESNQINPQHSVSVSYSPFVPGTVAVPLTDASPQFINGFTIVDGPQVKRRDTIGLKLDYKLGEHMKISLTDSWNSYFQQVRARTFRLSNRGPIATSVAPGSTTTDTTITNGGQADVFNDYSDFKTINNTISLRADYRDDGWKIDAVGSYSRSTSRVYDLPTFIQSIQFNLPGLSWRIQANPALPVPTGLSFLGGANPYDLSNYPGAPAVTVTGQTSPRLQKDVNIVGGFNIRRNFANFRFPMFLQAGGLYSKFRREKDAAQTVLSYVGPDGIAGTGDEVLQPAQFADTKYNDPLLYGIQRPPFLDPYKVGSYIQQYPNSFQDIQALNVQRHAVNTQSVTQDISSAYFAANIRINRLNILTGVRGERTENFARGAFRDNARGLGLPTTSRAYYQAIYSETKKYKSSYDDLFPQVQATYRFTPDLILRASLSRSMGRPDIQRVLPNTTVAESGASGTISVNNTGLLPQYSRNIDVGLEYYTKPLGSLSIDFFKKDITNYILMSSTTVGDGPDNGFDGLYSGYTLNTQSNVAFGHFQGIEAALHEQLDPILPRALRGFEAFASYTHYIKAEVPSGPAASYIIQKPLAPNYYDWSMTSGLSYTTPGRAFYVQLRNRWFPRALAGNPGANALPRYEGKHVTYDLSVRYRFLKKYAVELTGANITRDPGRKFYQGGRYTEERQFGAQYTLSLIANL